MIENFLVARSNAYPREAIGKLVGDSRVPGGQLDAVRRGPNRPQTNDY
jgi:hypothetical protein